MKRTSEKTSSRVLVALSLSTMLAVLLTSGWRKGREARATSYDKKLSSLDAAKR